MKFGIYSIRDVHTGFMAPTMEVNDNVAMRNFAHAVMNPQTIMHTHPANFSLMKIGVFDSETGDIENCLPIEVCNATSFL